MAVIGVGIDVVEIDRFEASLDRTPGLRERLFTPAEATRGAGVPGRPLRRQGGRRQGARRPGRHGLARRRGGLRGLRPPAASSCAAPSAPAPTPSASPPSTSPSPTTPASRRRSSSWRAPEAGRVPEHALCRGRGAHDLGRPRAIRSAATSAGSWRSSYAEQRTDTRVASHQPSATDGRRPRAGARRGGAGPRPPVPGSCRRPGPTRSRCAAAARPVDVSTLAVGERQPVSSAQTAERPPSAAECAPSPMSRQGAAQHRAHGAAAAVRRASRSSGRRW